MENKDKQKSFRRKVKEENQQEENLLSDNNLEVPLNPPKLPDKRHYIPFLPKIYWFFYRVLFLLAKLYRLAT